MRAAPELESSCVLDFQIRRHFRGRGGPQHLLHFGKALKIAKRQQIDVHVGVGLSSAAVDGFIGIGYSFSFQALRH